MVEVAVGLNFEGKMKKTQVLDEESATSTGEK